MARYFILSSMLHCHIFCTGLWTSSFDGIAPLRHLFCSIVFRPRLRNALSGGRVAISHFFI